MMMLYQNKLYASNLGVVCLFYYVEAVVVRRCSVKRFYLEFRKIHREAPVPETFFHKVTDKESLARVFSCEFCKISKNTFFTEHLQETASACSSPTFTRSLVQNQSSGDVSQILKRVF